MKVEKTIRKGTCEDRKKREKGKKKGGSRGEEKGKEEM